MNRKTWHLQFTMTPLLNPVRKKIIDMQKNHPGNCPHYGRCSKRFYVTKKKVSRAAFQK